MRKGETKSGFKFEVDERKADDMYFVRLLSKADKNPIYIDDVIIKLLGEEQTDALYKHLEDEEGRVSLEKAAAEFEEIMIAAGEETKNS